MIWCTDEVHEIENVNEQQDYKGPVTRSRTRAQDHIDSFMGETSNQDERISEEGFPILIHIEIFEGGPILGSFLQKEIIAEIINGCVQEYPMTIDILKEYECVVNMPKEMSCTRNTEHDSSGEEFVPIFSAQLLLILN